MNTFEGIELGVCPYCRTKMHVTSAGFGRYRPVGKEFVRYECPKCGATSPMTYYSDVMLDEDCVKEKILETIRNVQEDKEDEHEDD